MSKKKILLIGALLMLVGIVISFYGFSMMDFDYRRLSSDYGKKYTMTQKSFELAASDSVNLLIDISSADVYVKPSQNDKINVNYSPERYEVDLSNNNLTIKKSYQETNKKWYEYIRIFDISIGNEDFRDIEIEIPKGLIEDIDIDLKYGYISILDLEKVKSFEIDGKSSDIKLHNIKADESSHIHSDYGNATVSEISVSGKLNADFKSGNLYVKDSYINDGEIYMKYGNCDLDDIEGSVIKIEGSSSELNIKNVYTKEQLLGKTKYGNIKINNVNSSDIDLETSSGNISGYIDENEKAFSISTTVSSGETNLNDSFSGSKKLRAKSKYGNIMIDFRK